MTAGVPSGDIAVDTGFICFNDATYPNLIALFDHLGVTSRATDMSFAVSLDDGRFEYAAPGLFACLGYNGRGVALATAMGGEIARLVTGTPARDIAMPVTPIRPIPFHGFWRIGVIAKVMEGRIRDRFGL